MKRNPRKVKWTKAFRRAAGKEMTVDSTLEFEKRRNIPVRYDRELMATTIKAMKRVQQIKSKRERVFFKQRMTGKKEREMAESLKSLHQNIELVDAPELKQKLMEHKLAETPIQKDMEIA
ncbi:hypothetical protein BDV3_000258 [Batrachochytrium dendrobatidis]|nr:ribosomal protein L24e, variant [Batrachochytrium dendrobatidis JEL423]